MSAAYTWSYARADGTEVSDLGIASTAFPSQAEAETWLEREWPTLANVGVEQVTLLRGEETVYGPMSLGPA